jgi:transposase-like protein
MQNAKKGLSACQAARDIEMRRPTVWSMMQRIRKSMKDNGRLLEGIVEMDETYIGGKPKKENHKDGNNNKSNPRGRGTKKTPVVGMIERGGDVKAKAVSKNSLKAKDLLKLIRQHINTKETILLTDEYTAYNNMNDIVPHYAINHSYKFAKGDIHTNTIESFWAIVKRGIMGQFHNVIKKYLNAYLDEFCYRYNARNIDSALVFGRTLDNMLRV